MSSFQQFTLTFTINASPRVLFTLISSSEGLSRWFADKVIIDQDNYVFEWEGSNNSGKLIGCKENEFIKIHLSDDDHDGHIMEMHISHEPLSGETALIITDFAEDQEVEFSLMWWSTQVGKLQRLFNS
jgi:uncharacterized protein YndB with AHSA1/START domain